jgi:hypothetical protein
VTKESILNFIGKLEKHATIKLPASVIAELRAISPSSYVGFFDPGEEVERWLSSKFGHTLAPMLAALEDQKKALEGCFDY